MMNIELSELLPLLCKEHKQPWKVGESWFFRTVTMAQVGKIVSIDGPFVTLETASWIADTGRFHDALKSGEFDEVEPFPQGCVVNTGALVDACPWPHALPTSQK
jgi:hypothetical protein